MLALSCRRVLGSACADMPYKPPPSGHNLKSIIVKMLQFTTAPNKTAVAAAELFQALSRQTFTDKRTPEGEQWAPAKDGHPNLLVQTGAMRAGVKGLVQRAGRVVLWASDHKSRWHLRDYAKRNPRKRDDKGRFLKGPTTFGRVIRPARRFLPLPGNMPAGWRVKALALIIGLRMFWRR